jgi:small subunit ribosomal protein S14
MKSKLRFDRIKRVRFSEGEITRRILLYLRKNTSSLILNIVLGRFSRNLGYLSRISNRCVITGRSKSTYRRFGFSRIVLRKLFLRGILRGVRKSSW